MRCELVGVEVTGPEGGRVDVSGPGPVTVGAFLVEATITPTDHEAQRVTWSVANRGEAPGVPQRVRLVWRIVDPPETLRFFRHGFQSWSPSWVATFGVDRDPSTDERCFRFVRDAYLGDPDRCTGHELRSELVTVLGPPGGPWWCVGFEAGTEHDGTLRLRDGAAGPELVTEAFLGGAQLAGGERRELHPVRLTPGDDPSTLLEGWAAVAGQVGRARVDAPYQVGWCSWYHYFHDVTEQAVRANLAVAGEWPFAVFQVDDGYQSEIGDWLTTNDRFPSGIAALADDIAAAGYQPGIWLAPFLAAPGSRVAQDHPDWLVQLPDGPGPLPSWFNPPWGGVMWGLDTTHPEVLAHLEATAAALVDAGYGYLKLDFTLAPALDGRGHDPSRTPAQRVRAGYDAVRRGAGEDVFILGCGAPIGPCIGVVDGMRIGPDVAPSWDLPTPPFVPNLPEIEPATSHAYRNTLTRSFQHRRLWLNDPDCLMLRTTETAMGPDAVRTWAHAVALSGGMALVSDDLALLGPDAHALLDEVIAVGRRVDDDARRGAGARCPDLLDDPSPRRLAADGRVLDADPSTGRSTLAGGQAPKVPNNE